MRTPGFWRRYIFSIDHKIIGIQYGLTALAFLLFGFCLMGMMRWQIAHPGQPVPVVGPLLATLFGDVAAKGVMSPDLYNTFGAMHGTIMVFLAVVPLLTGAFGNYLVPIQVGACDMAFPRLNMASYQFYFLGGVIMFASFFIPGGAAQSGWTSYPPLSLTVPTDGQTYWLVGMVFLITSSLLGSANIITTIIQLRAPGHDLDAAAVFHLGAVRRVVPAAAGLSAAGSRGRDATHGQGHGFEPLPADRSGGGRKSGRSGRGRQSDPVAAPVLVSGASGGLRSDSAGDGHRRGDYRQQHPQADLGLQVAGLCLARLGFHLLHCLGASHVSDRHGHDDRHVLPNHDDDHLHPVGHHSDLPVDLAVGRLDPLQHARCSSRWPFSRCLALAV